MLLSYLSTDHYYTYTPYNWENRIGTYARNVSSLASFPMSIDSKYWKNLLAFIVGLGSAHRADLSLEQREQLAKQVGVMTDVYGTVFALLYMIERCKHHDPKLKQYLEPLVEAVGFTGRTATVVPKEFILAFPSASAMASLLFSLADKMHPIPPSLPSPPKPSANRLTHSPIQSLLRKSPIHSPVVAPRTSPSPLPKRRALSPPAVQSPKRVPPPPMATAQWIIIGARNRACAHHQLNTSVQQQLDALYRTSIMAC
jgi:hypothetical protein